MKANNVYQEYIQDKQHLHMNSTRWVSLTEFIKHLGRSGIAHVDETEKGWFIAWIDNSPKALAKQASAAMKERSTMTDEQMERLLIAEQINKAKAERNDDEVDAERLKGLEEGFKRDEAAEKVVLSLKPKTAPSPSAPQTSDSASSSAPSPAPETSSQSSAPTSITTSAPAVKVGFNAFKANPLKPTGVNPLKANVFKTSSTSSRSSDDSKGKRKEPISMAEQLIFEDQQRKRRKMEREADRE